MKLSNITQPTNSSIRPLTIYKDGGLCCACFEALCPNAERACREAVWLEHRQLPAEREDMDDIVQAIEKIHEHRLEFKPAAANKGG